MFAFRETQNARHADVVIRLSGVEHGSFFSIGGRSTVE